MAASCAAAALMFAWLAIFEASPGGVFALCVGIVVFGTLAGVGVGVALDAHRQLRPRPPREWIAPPPAPIPPRASPPPELSRGPYR